MRPRRPFPSRKGWRASNSAWRTASCTRRSVAFRWDVALPGAHRIGQSVRPDRHEGRFDDTATGRPNPVGRPTILARRLALAAHPAQQYRMRFPDYPQGQRQLLEHLLRPPHGGAIVEHLADVVTTCGGFRFLSRFELQHFAHRRLGTFDARGKHGFAGGERGEQNAGVRNGGKHAVITRHCRRGRADEWNQLRPIQAVVRRESAHVVMNGRHHSSPNPRRARFALMAASSSAASSCWPRSCATRRFILSSSGSSSSSCGAAPT